MEVPYVKYFELSVTFKPSSNLFQAKWNGEDLEPYYVPSQDQEVIFQDTTASGDMSLYYLGYSFLGKGII